MTCAAALTCSNMQRAGSLQVRRHCPVFAHPDILKTTLFVMETRQRQTPTLPDFRWVLPLLPQTTQRVTRHQPSNAGEGEISGVHRALWTNAKHAGIGNETQSIGHRA